jgi:uncharacterized Zn-binding protein involved in type VI secretion
VGSRAIVQNDRIEGACAIHQVPNPTSGAPQPGPPMRFSAPLTVGLAPKVRIGGKAAAVVGSSGANQPPHAGLHVSDPYAVPAMQVGRVVSGSMSVRFGGQPAATASSSVTMCQTPGSLVATITDVMVG